MNTCTPWTTAETKTLRRVYPIGGSAACAPLIPRHNASAIQRRASELKVSAPVPDAIRPACEVSDDAKATILAAVRRGLRSGDYVRLSVETGVPSWTVKKLAKRLAAEHDLPFPKFGARPWEDPAELRLLEDSSHMSADEIVRVLAAAGFVRTRTAVRNRLNILGLARDIDDHMTAKELSRRLGFDSGMIRRDIEAGRLHAIPRPGVLRPELRRGNKRWWWISDRAVHQWLLAEKKRLAFALHRAPPEWRLWLADLLGDMPTVDDAKRAVNGVDTGGVPAHWMEAA